MKPFFAEAGIQIFHGDCREVLPALGLSHAFGFADPPYNVGKDYGGWDDALPDGQYLQFAAEWVAVLKSACPMIAYYECKKYELEYHNLFGRDYRQVILPFTPEGAIRYGFVDQFASLRTNGKPILRTKNVWPGCALPGQGYFFREETYDHPGYTSADVTRRVLKHFCAELVVDPFGGTGTTAVEAKKAGLSAVLIEYNERYCEVAADRLRQAVFLFSPETDR